MYHKLVQKLSLLTGYSAESVSKYSINTIWLFIERVISMLIGLTVGIAVARYLGPHDYGVISYGLTLYAMALSFSTLGIDDLVIRDTLNTPENEGRIFGTTYIFRFVASIVSFIGFLFFAFFTTEQGYLLPVVLIMSAVLVQPAGILALYFRMVVKSKFAATAIMCAYITSSAIKLVLIYMGAPILFFACAILLDSFIQVALLIYFYRKKRGSFGMWTFDKSYAFYLVKECWPLTIMIVFGIIYSKIDILLINKLLGSDDVGLYSVAVRLTEVWYHIPHVLAASVFPAIISSRRGSEDEYKSRIAKMLHLTTLLGLSFGIFVTLASNYIVGILYGEAYAEAGAVLAIYCWCLMFISFNVVTSKWIMTENYLLLGLYRIAASIIVGTTLSYFFITRYGITGAATAAVISGALSSYFFDLFSSKTRYLFMLKTQSIFFPLIFAYRFVKSRAK